MQRGGWGNDGVLKNVYRHAMTGKAKEMNQKANNYFNKMQHEMQHEKNNPSKYWGYKRRQPDLNW